MKIAISGASGFIGRRLTASLKTHELVVLSRSRTTAVPPGARLSIWEPMSGPPLVEDLAGTDVVIHLAGEPVAQRWTADARRRIRDSRVTGTRRLVEGLAQLKPAPRVLLSASAIGIYGSRGDEPLTENSAPGSDFLAEVCQQWEREAAAAESIGVRVVRIRTGLALDAKGGALARLLPPFRLGLGGPIGSGRQWMSWIHIDDLVRLYLHSIDVPLSGAINGVAPEPVVNSEFTRVLGMVLQRPAILRIPEFALKIAFGDMSAVLLASQKVMAASAEAAGFHYGFRTLESALRNLLVNAQ